MDNEKEPRADEVAHDRAGYAADAVIAELRQDKTPPAIRTWAPVTWEQVGELIREIERLGRVAESLALSLESAGLGRHIGGRMCTPLESYRAGQNKPHTSPILPQTGR